MAFTCSVCGEHHDEALRDIRAGLPEPVFRLSEDEREERVRLGDDWCVYRDPSEKAHHYARGLLTIPMTAPDDHFGYGVWVELDERDFDRLGRLWGDPSGSEAEPFRGRLANDLRPYSQTEGLPVTMRLREVELLPLVEVLADDHPLGRDQQEGIDAAAAQRLAEVVLHR